MKIDNIIKTSEFIDLLKKLDFKPTNDNLLNYFKLSTLCFMLDIYSDDAIISAVEEMKDKEVVSNDN